MTLPAESWLCGDCRRLAVERERAERAEAERIRLRENGGAW